MHAHFSRQFRSVDIITYIIPHLPTLFPNTHHGCVTQTQSLLCGAVEYLVRYIHVRFPTTYDRPGTLDDESLLPFGSATGSVALKTV